MLRDLRRVGVAATVGKEPCGVRSRQIVVGMLESRDGEREAGLVAVRSAGNGRKLPVNAIAFRELWWAMVEGGGTVADLAEASGLHRTAVRRAVNALKEGGKARIGSWESLGNGWAPYWVMGVGSDAKRPSKEPRKVVSARYWARRRERLRFESVQASLALKDAA